MYMVAGLDEAGLHSTYAITRPHCQALDAHSDYARVHEYEAPHARKASKGLVLRRVQARYRCAKRRRVGQRRGGRKGAPPRPSHESEAPGLHDMS
jgi:hypothetical protein